MPHFSLELSDRPRAAREYPCITEAYLPHDPNTALQLRRVAPVREHLLRHTPVPRHFLQAYGPIVTVGLVGFPSSSAPRSTSFLRTHSRVAIIGTHTGRCAPWRSSRDIRGSCNLFNSSAMCGSSALPASYLTTTTAYGVKMSHLYPFPQTLRRRKSRRFSRSEQKNR